MRNFFAKYRFIPVFPEGKQVNCVVTTSSLYGHFCKIHRILSVQVLILYIIGLFGSN
ncbi:hypothetical protein SAMN04515674_11414 [Pseudarcicella hirudinis]|uniref:Uncharacterized protein n=1 Tax=Pseudarcicella hirudinis TaxID=1079859 RepID=A0A1I5X9R5_9BACT|nr:hypothetical protein SAMN04515674_11414 [Pseudarcicella hirudinis]